ncbi:hypothetical protein [Halobaculum sp. EA56]|uniref:hypothetical protein n=1 Tax=Halobaculum sp. EA56 TaxID=3421648 RepID=UPI003EBCAAE1
MAPSSTAGGRPERDRSDPVADGRGAVPGTRGALALALALLVVAAGCAGIVDSGGDGGDERTVNPALRGTPTATATPPDGFPPGVDAGGVDVDRLIDAHREALAGGSWTVTLTRAVEGPNGTVERSRARLRVDGERRLYTFERVRGDDRTASAHWSNGTAAASRRVDWEGNVSLEGRTGDPDGLPGPGPAGGAWLRAAFLDVRPSYAGTESTAYGTAFVLHAREGRIERAGLPDRRRVSLRARIDTAGVVRSLSLRYEIFLGSAPGTVAVVFETTAVNDTTVPRPEWVDRALANASEAAADGGANGNGDAGNRTGDATGSDGDAALYVPGARVDTG